MEKVVVIFFRVMMGYLVEGMFSAPLIWNQGDGRLGLGVLFLQIRQFRGLLAARFPHGHDQQRPHAIDDAGQNQDADGGHLLDLFFGEVLFHQSVLAW